jgi:hypothetical protein
LMKSLFTSLNSEVQKQKLSNHFSIIEKGQAQNQLTVSRHELKKHLLEGLVHEFAVLSKRSKVLLIGPLASLIQEDTKDFNWPDLIMKKGLL